MVTRRATSGSIIPTTYPTDIVWSAYPGFPNWERTAEYYINGVVIVYWRDITFDLLACYIDAYNINPYGGNTASVILDSVQYTLDPQSGVSWMNPNYLLQYATTVAYPTHVSSYLASKIAVPDPYKTSETGSPGIDYYGTYIAYGEYYGKDDALFNALESYRKWQVLRPRHWRDTDGMPVGFMTPTAGLVNFNELAVNNTGRNAYDNQHLELTELWYASYLLPDVPVYFDQMVNLISHAMCNALYWDEISTNNYGGAVRSCGSLLTACSLMLDIIDRVKTASGTTYWDTFRTAVYNKAFWHYTNEKNKFPIAMPWYEGNKDPWYALNKEDYYFAHKYASLAWGIQQFYYATGLSEVATHENDVLTWADKMFCDADYVWTPPPVKTAGQSYKSASVSVDILGFPIFNGSDPYDEKGVGTYLVAPCTRALSGSIYDMETHMLKRFSEWGWTNPSNSGHRYYVDKAAPAAGYLSPVFPS